MADDTIESLEQSKDYVIDETIAPVRPKIGIALNRNSPDSYIPESAPERYVPLECLFRSDYEMLDLPSDIVRKIEDCRSLLIGKTKVRIVDACAGQQSAIKGFISRLSALMEQGLTHIETVLLSIYDKNLNPNIFMSPFSLPNKRFKLDDVRIRDARDPFDSRSPEPTLYIISYSDLYVTEDDYYQMIQNGLDVADIVVVIPGTFSLYENEVSLRVIYKTDDGYDSFLLPNELLSV